MEVSNFKNMTEDIVEREPEELSPFPVDIQISEKGYVEGEVEADASLEKYGKEQSDVNTSKPVLEEIEITRKLELGPTEDDIRRRKLIEIDDEILEKRARQLRKLAFKELHQALGDRGEINEKLINCRRWITNCLKKAEAGDFGEHSEEVTGWLEDELAVHQERLVDSNGERVDYQAYLQKSEEELRRLLLEDDEKVSQTLKDEGDESEGEGEGENVAATTLYDRVTSPETTREEVIVFSDSSDDEHVENEEDSDNDVATGPSTAQRPVTTRKLPLHPQLEKSVLCMDHLESKRREKISRLLEELPTRTNPREALHLSLQRKVVGAARVNLCRQLRISTDFLKLRTEITEKCRLFIDLLRDREERHQKMIRIEQEKERRLRRERYLAEADDDNEEFDDEYAAKNIIPMTEEELVQLDDSRESDTSDDSSEDDGQEDDESIDDQEGDVDAIDNETDTMVREKEEEIGDEDKKEGLVVSEAGRNAISIESSSNSDPIDGPIGECTSASSPKISVSYGRHRHVADDSVDNICSQPEITMDSDNVADTPIEAEPEHGNQDMAEEREQGTNLAEDTSQVIKQRKAARNMEYRRAIEAEERLHRMEKTQGNHLLEFEADEEEEVGLQAGLGDFGFTRSGGKDDDEQGALQIRKGDFDNIVDSISDDEGDEAAAEAARLQLERQDDRAQTKAIIAAVTEGREAGLHAAKQGRYSHSKLLSSAADSAELDRMNNGGNSMQTGEEEEGELDLEEELQRRMQSKIDRELENDRRRYGSDGDDMSEDSNADTDVDDNNMHLMTAEERETEEQKRLQRLERQRIENIKIQQFARQNKLVRMLRRKNKQDAKKREKNKQKKDSSESNPLSLLRPFSLDDDVFGSFGSSLSRTPHSVSTQQSELSISNDLPTPPPADIVVENPSKRRKSSPKKFDASSLERRKLTSKRPTVIHEEGSLSQSRTYSQYYSSVRPGNGSALKRSTTSLYQGALDQEEVLAGYGMGMAVPGRSASASIKRSTSFAQSSLFNAVVGKAPTIAAATGVAVEAGLSFMIAEKLARKRSFAARDDLPLRQYSDENSRN